MNITASQTQTFQTLRNLEQETRTNAALAAMGSDLKTRWRGEDNLKISNAKMCAVLDSLTMEEAKVYGEWRLTH